MTSSAMGEGTCEAAGSQALRRSALALAAVLALAAGGHQPGSEGVSLETRTFVLKHLRSEHAATLIGPYVYADRIEAPGDIQTLVTGRALGTAPGAITVRETPDNLDKIARVLEELDVVDESSSYRLHFQVLAANGAGPVDPRLAEVVTELRKVFRFDGYTLQGEAYLAISAAGGGAFTLAIETADWSLREKTGASYRLTGAMVFQDQLEVDVRATTYQSTSSLATRFGFHLGQTVVLGTMPLSGETIFIVVHIDQAPPAT